VLLIARKSYQGAFLNSPTILNETVPKTVNKLNQPQYIKLTQRKYFKLE